MRPRPSSRSWIRSHLVSSFHVKPARTKWTWESINPGTTRRPSTSTTVVAWPASAARSSLAPTVSTRPERIAIASDWCGRPPMSAGKVIFPFRSTRSGPGDVTMIPPLLQHGARSAGATSSSTAAWCSASVRPTTRQGTAVWASPVAAIPEISSVFHSGIDVVSDAQGLRDVRSCEFLETQPDATECFSRSGCAALGSQ